MGGEFTYPKMVPMVLTTTALDRAPHVGPAFRRRRLGQSAVTLLHDCLLGQRRDVTRWVQFAGPWVSLGTLNLAVPSHPVPLLFRSF